MRAIEDIFFPKLFSSIQKLEIEIINNFNMCANIKINQVYESKLVHASNVEVIRTPFNVQAGS